MVEDDPRSWYQSFLERGMKCHRHDSDGGVGAQLAPGGRGRPSHLKKPMICPSGLDLLIIHPLLSIPRSAGVVETLSPVEWRTQTFLVGLTTHD